MGSSRVVRAAVRIACAMVFVVMATSGQQVVAQQALPSNHGSSEALFARYCVGCHNARLRTAGLAIDELDLTEVHADAEAWEKVVEKLRAGSMPPPGRPRPEPAAYAATASWLEEALDEAWDAGPQPGRISAVHRMNRTEYRNAIRDLFALDVDVASLLPGDETADGSFDNFAQKASQKFNLKKYGIFAGK